MSLPGRNTALFTPLICLAGLASSGCAIGIGNTYVGELAARRELDHSVVLEDERGGRTHIDVERERPDRSFQGLSVLMPIGVSQVTEAGHESTVTARGEIGVQYLRGRGGWAYGARASVLLDGPQLDRVMIPVMALGYVSLAERLGLHAGLGYAPYSAFTHGSVTSTDASVVRGLLGADLLLLRRKSTHFSLNTEIDTALTLAILGAYRSSSLTTSLAIKF